MTTVPETRVRRGNEKGRNPEGGFVLYWMTAFRRLGWNFALQHAADLARRLEKPLVILEALRVDYPHASHRLHRFILEGMEERARALEGTPVLYYPFVEKEAGEGRGLLAAVGKGACCVVTDDFPSFFLPRMVATAASILGVRLDVVDSNGLLPMRVPDKVFSSAYHFRRFLQNTLPEHLPELPDPEPLQERLPMAPSSGGDILPAEVLGRWPPATRDLLSGTPEALRRMPLDFSVAPVSYAGTTTAARSALRAFLDRGLPRYADDRNHPDLDVTSGLSPYLHFGAISAQEVFAEVASVEGWTPLRLSPRADGARAGWWGMGAGAEAFLDQLLTWRELGFNFSSRREDYAAYGSLPGWARETLEAHGGDPRPHRYTVEELREARTHDPLWNAAQRQLLEEGRIHNYLRMLWGKKILEWSPSARVALEVMIELNDGLAVDGRDPNSYSGIFWCLGRYDRGWPERPVFGKVRSMSSEATKRKVKLKKYLRRYSEKTT
ncbi:MAG: deoxyribodipyrimidine photolyase [Longimicrobiales bacterium]